MAPTRILINGAGVAGPTLAVMLLSSPRSYAITVVERSKSLRTGGQQIDLHAQGLPVVQRKKKGLLAAIKARCVNESGIGFVDSDGKIKAELGVNDTGHGPQTLVSEYEIDRGDLVDIMYETSLGAAKRAGARSGARPSEMLRYEFGKYATQFGQQTTSGEVEVAFSDGSKGSFDLVVGADGQSSRTRRILFGEEANKATFHPVGVYSALFNIPRDDAVEGDPHVAKIFHAPGKRTLGTRTGDRSSTQATKSTTKPSRRLVEAMGKGLHGIVEQKKAWEDLFRGAGWQADRLLKGLQTTDDYYAYQSGQVKLEKWHNGRVVLLGDAGYCPSPNTGMGTTCSLVGCYILAGELARHGEDIDAALQGYEKVARPFIEEPQKLPKGLLRWWYRDTRIGIRVMHMVLAAVTNFKIDKLLYKLLPEAKGGLELPEYPELEQNVTEKKV